MPLAAVLAGVMALPSFAQTASSGGAGAGAPILLDEGDPPPPPRLVTERRIIDLKYEDGSPRVKRQAAIYSDDSVVNNGVYQEYYASGQIFVDGAYSFGDRTGEWTFHHPNGEVAKKVNYVDGAPDGPIEVRRADGALQEKREFKAGKRTGAWIAYGESGEQVLSERSYDDGAPTGVWKTWYPSGQQRQEIPFKDGQKDGVERVWYEDGSPRSEAEFSGGKRNGLTVQWDRNGKRTERRFVDNKLQLAD